MAMKTTFNARPEVLPVGNLRTVVPAEAGTPCGTAKSTLRVGLFWRSGRWVALLAPLRGAGFFCERHWGSPLRCDPRLLSATPPGWSAEAGTLCGNRGNLAVRFAPSAESVIQIEVIGPS